MQSRYPLSNLAHWQGRHKSLKTLDFAVDNEQCAVYPNSHYWMDTHKRSHVFWLDSFNFILNFFLVTKFRPCPFLFYQSINLRIAKRLYRVFPQFNHLTPYDIKHLNSPYNITPESKEKVTRIKEMTTTKEALDC